MFKQFTPRVDKDKRLVITRFYAGIKGNNTFCYTVSRINKKGELDKKFKPLYAFGTDDFSSVKTFVRCAQQFCCDDICLSRNNLVLTHHQLVKS